MSESNANESSSEPRREPSIYLSAAEFNMVTEVYQEDREYAPKYHLLPTMVGANRVVVCGKFLEFEWADDDESYARARISGPTGTFFAYAGEYQPKARDKILELAEKAASEGPPPTVLVKAKVDSFVTDDGERNVNLQPEMITEAPDESFVRWVTDMAYATMDRIENASNGEQSIETDVPDSEFDVDEDELQTILDEVIDALEHADAIAQQGSVDIISEADAEGDTAEASS